MATKGHFQPLSGTLLLMLLLSLIVLFFLLKLFRRQLSPALVFSRNGEEFKCYQIRLPFCLELEKEL